MHMQKLPLATLELTLDFPAVIGMGLILAWAPPVMLLRFSYHHGMKSHTQLPEAPRAAGDIRDLASGMAAG